jgi:RNA-directed DNA polymerase
MGRWNRRWHAKYKKHSLINQVYELSNLEKAFKAVKSNKGAPGIDGVTIGQFEKHLEKNLLELQRLLREQKYVPQPVRRVYIPKANGGQRPLGIPTVRDRVVQQAVKNVLEPIFEEIFLGGSFGYRPGRSAQQAIKRAAGVMSQDYWWVVDADIKGFFDNVNHETLLDLVNEQVADGRVLKLLRLFLESGVLDGGEFEETPIGTPQGGVISPLLANIMLNHLDRRLGENGYVITRYADDFLIHCRTKPQAETALKLASKILVKELHLQLSQEKTKILNVCRGVTFLGIRIARTDKIVYTPGKKAVKRFMEAVRDKTVRHLTVPLRIKLNHLNPTVRGWGNYFSICGNNQTIKRLDKWLIKRVRSCIYRRRAPGWGCVKYPKAYIENAGLITLASLMVRKEAVSPSKKVGGSERRRIPSLIGKVTIRPRAVCGKTARTVL